MPKLMRVRALWAPIMGGAWTALLTKSEGVAAEQSYREHAKGRGVWVSGKREEVAYTRPAAQ